MDSNTIVEAFLAIQAYDNLPVGPAKEIHFENVYPDFKKSYPYLYHKACTDASMDVERLKYMLQIRDMMTNETISSEDASKQVGQTFFDMYVKPMLASKDEEGN